MGDQQHHAIMTNTGGAPVDSAPILSTFRCPVCMEFVRPPIRQCIKGHVVCQKCIASLVACLVCRSPFSTERNTTLETIATQLPFPCQFAALGCTQTFFLTRREEHEGSCRFQPYPCPFCDVKIPSTLQALKDHVSVVHRNKPIFKDRLDIGIKFHEAHDIKKLDVYQIHCLLIHQGEAFIVSMRYLGETQEWQFFVQIFNSKSAAEKFSFRLELRLYDKFLCSEGKVTSWRDTTDSLVNRCDCLVLTDKYFQGAFYGGTMSCTIRKKTSIPPFQQQQLGP